MFDPKESRGWISGPVPETLEEFIEEIATLDADIADIERQVSEHDAKLEQNFVWRARAVHASRCKKARREKLTKHYGIISRKRQLAAEHLIAQSFMDAANLIFDPVDIEEVWDRVYAEHPELREVRVKVREAAA